MLGLNFMTMLSAAAHRSGIKALFGML